jgi:hypothetical protein
MTPALPLEHAPPLDEPEGTEAAPPVPRRLPDAIFRQPLIDVAHDRALLRMPGAGRMLVSAEDIVVALSPGSSRAHLAPLADPALALQWLLRAVPALRAASVAHGDRGVLLTGTGPVGASTIAAGLALRGWRVLGDAVAPIMVADGTIAVVPTTDTLGLWPDSMAALGLDAEVGTPIRPGLAKRAVPASDLGAPGAHLDGAVRSPGPLVPVPVDMVVLVRQSNHEPLGAVAYRGFQAVSAVGRSAWHHAVALALHGSAGHFSWATVLASGARIVRVTLPRRADPLAVAGLVAGIADGAIEVAAA